MTEAAVTETWTIERYQDGDEAALLELFTTVFDRPRSREHWSWQFRDNPYGGPFVSMARSRRDRAVVASYSVMPMMLNLMGKPVAACQSVDTAVHPEWRNQRLFEHTASDCYEWGHARGLKAVIGFPNARSYPGFLRTLGWRRIAFPRQYRLRVNVRQDLARTLPLGPLAAIANSGFRAALGARLATRQSMLERQAGGRVAIQATGVVPADYEQLWSMVRSQEVLSVWKDADYLRWRYDRNPDHRFRYFALRRGDELVGLAVTVDLDSVLTICELMVRGRDVPMARLLVNHIARHALAIGASTVQFIGHDMGFFDEAFEGFERRLSTANVYCGRAFEDGVMAELLPHGDNWTITFGDGDFV